MLTRCFKKKIKKKSRDEFRYMTKKKLPNCHFQLIDCKNIPKKRSGKKIKNIWTTEHLDTVFHF